MSTRIKFKFEYNSKEIEFMLDNHPRATDRAMFLADRMINHCADGYWKLTDVDNNTYKWVPIYGW